MRSSGVCGLWTLEPCLFCRTFLQAAVAAATAIFSWLWMCFFSASLQIRIWSTVICTHTHTEKAKKGKKNSEKADFPKRGASWRVGVLLLASLQKGAHYRISSTDVSHKLPLKLGHHAIFMEAHDGANNAANSEFSSSICLRAMACDHWLI
jgi:hypothetical protein